MKRTPRVPRKRPGPAAPEAPHVPPAAASRFVPPYPPSWVDRLAARVDRLPIPWWLAYALLAAVFSGVVAVALWQIGVYAIVGFHPMQIWIPTLAAYLLGLTHGLDRAAASSMKRFRPAFRGDEADYAAAVYRMTTLPARPTLIFTVVATIVTLPMGSYEMSQIQTGGLMMSPALFTTLLVILYAIFYVWFFHIWRQLREIHRLYRDWAQVRLTDIRPLYALSRVTSLTALGIVVFNYGWFLAQPGANPTNPVTVGETLFNLVLAVAVFVLPLWGAHRLLSEKKEQALSGLAARKEATRAQLHQAVDAGKLARVDPLHKALEALQAEFAEVGKTATWPWAPGTLRNLMGAVLLPMALWLIQFALQKVLG